MWFLGAIIGLALAVPPATGQTVDSLAARADRLAICGSQTVTIFAGDGPAAPPTYRVELALTPEEQRRGLMFRERMDADAGMLFVFDQPREASFWMRNTFIPLDIIFIDTAGRVLNVGEGVPFSEASVRSEGVAGAVLELNRGQAEAHGIGPGAQLLHPAFRAAPGDFRCPPAAPFTD
ncbi:MAG: DUF192 domain-containing protein [Pseudomonadota bacterium]